MLSLFRSTFLSSSRFFSSVTIFWVGPVLVDGKIRWCWSVKVLQPFVVSDLLETFSEQTFICVVKKWNVVEKSLTNLLKWISWSFRVIRILFVIEETCNCRQQNEHHVNNNTLAIFPLSCTLKHLNKIVLIQKILISWSELIAVLLEQLQPFSIQLFRERLSEKVHATIPNGIVGGF